MNDNIDVESTMEQLIVVTNEHFEIPMSRLGVSSFVFDRDEVWW